MSDETKYEVRCVQCNEPLTIERVWMDGANSIDGSEPKTTEVIFYVNPYHQIPTIRQTNREALLMGILDCKDLNCPFLNKDTNVIGGECLVTPEECPREDGKIKMEKVMEVITRRWDKAVELIRSTQKLLPEVK